MKSYKSFHVVTSCSYLEGQLGCTLAVKVVIERRSIFSSAAHTE